MAKREYNINDPLYYDQYYPMDAEHNPCEAAQQDVNFAEYIGIFGKLCDIYLCTYYDPVPVFGEDPVKRYEIAPIVSKGLWNVTSEVLNIGSFGKTAADEEVLTIWFHKNTVKQSIKTSLIENGLLPPDDTIIDPSTLSKYDRHRSELQEGDIIRLHFNNMHYEIDNVNLEPDYQPLLAKYVYEVIARPRLVAGEFLGQMQPVTDADANREIHEDEIQSEANKILF